MWGESRSSEPVRGLKLHELGLDEAFVNVSSRGFSRQFWLYSLRPECQKCPYQLVGDLPAESDRVLKLNSKFSWQFRVLNENLGEYVSASNKSSVLCEIDKPLHLGEFGVYDIEVRSQGQDDGTVSCNFSTFLEPVNMYLPMVLISALTLLVVFGYVWIRRAQKQFAAKYGHHTEIELQAGLNDEKNSCDKNANNIKLNQRSLAIDTFRGFCMFLIVFYNHGQGGYAVFTHIAWDGLQLADIPFPWFIWIMGMCIPLSVNSILKKNVTRLQITKGIIKRSLLLFVVGLILTGYENGPKLETFRVMHVLQRFGVLCLIAGSLCAALWPRNINKVEAGELRDVRILAPQWAVHLIIQLTHLSLTFFLPVPGCPTGYLGPGGLHDDMKYTNCTGGVAGYIDRLILPPENLFQHCTPKELYRTGNFEPEGIYTTLPTLLSVILGMQAGATLLTFDSIRSRVYRWCVWGISCLSLASLLSLTEIIPFNKNLWSTSFALVTSGLGFLALALCHLVVDGWRYWHGAPFIYYGRNALLVYGGTKLTAQVWPWYWQYGKMDTHTVLWLNTCWSAILWLYTVRELHRRKIFIKF